MGRNFVEFEAKHKEIIPKNPMNITGIRLGIAYHGGRQKFSEPST
jgi:hypothetical protein